MFRLGWAAPRRSAEPQTVQFLRHDRCGGTPRRESCT
jgi:hypothetical protein